jgi:predicted metalloprotease
MKGAGSPEHGTSQQRIAAFELGYDTGDLDQCLALATDGTTTGGAT